MVDRTYLERSKDWFRRKFQFEIMQPHEGARYRDHEKLRTRAISLR